MDATDSNQKNVLVPGTGRKKRKPYEWHGEWGTKLYKTWRNIKTRCFNPKYDHYQDYGGRGITVCKEWCDSFIVFRDWAMLHGYQEGLEIDRIDNDGGYSPENCRFVTRSQNAMNTRKRKGCKSKYRGICWESRKKLWRASIQINGHSKGLGRFKAQLAAALAYDDAAHELHGEFAMLNFPERKR